MELLLDIGYGKRIAVFFKLIADTDGPFKTAFYVFYGVAVKTKNSLFVLNLVSTSMIAQR